MGKKYDIKWYDTLDSTNDEALRHSDTLDNMSVLAAHCQTAGRGQKGNIWEAEKGMNLTFSIFLRFYTMPQPAGGTPGCIRAGEQFRISEAATLAQCRLLSRHGIDARIKWPNDIYVGNRKISGMLVENSLSGEFLRTSVIGIGLNVNQTSFPSRLSNPTSMSAVTGKSFDTEKLLEEFMEIFSESIGTIYSPEELKEEYEALLYKKGAETCFADMGERPAYLPANAVLEEDSAGKKVFKGTIIGIGGSGMLEIRLADGSVREFGFKEIAYIIPSEDDISRV